jgi:hypothetical protein
MSLLEKLIQSLRLDPLRLPIALESGFNLLFPQKSVNLLLENEMIQYSLLLLFNVKISIV